MNNRDKGFTVIELVVAITIVCLLVAVAVASYQDHMSRKARTQARTALVEMSDVLHVQYSRLGAYPMTGLPISQTPRDGEAVYKINLAATPVTSRDPAAVFPGSSALGFTLVAVPVHSDECGSLILDHAGRKGVTGEGAKAADCWSN